MNDNPFLRLRAAKFAIKAGEAEELVNDGIYGKALAEYLQTQLASRGYSMPCVICEDWGWWVEVGGLPFGCGLCVYGLQIDDSNDLDLCVTVSSPTGRTWSWRKFRFIDTTSEVHRLYHNLRTILREDVDVTVLGESAEFPLT
jgi:hypothetical protein